ncbi:MAG: FAD-dependent oxidoreductase, partial [Chloroflexi bacterium]|nr:FAD-dependent oxidoreductase [Chloroflexota bacterium]
MEVETSVLVVGGGSSGAVAAIAAADEGVSSTVVDMNPGLGGTGTFGGINTYWFCRRFGFVDRLMGWLDEIHDRLHIPRPTGVLAHWNVEARVQALREQAERAGVRQVLGALVFGTVVNGNRVRGVVAATAYGPVALLGQVTLDATGDGDVAAWAGAEVVY